MKKMKYKGRGVGIALILLLAISGSVWAAGNIRISTSDNAYRIMGWDDSPMTPTLGTNLEFFYSSAPAEPFSTSGIINPTVTTPTGYINYFFDGSSKNVVARTWYAKTTASDLKGSYYGISSAGYDVLNSLAAGTMKTNAASEGASQWWLKAFKTDYYADAPSNAPTWGNVSESSVRIGATPDVQLSLSVGFSYALGTPKREVTGYLLRFWKDGETDPGDLVVAADNIRVFQLAGGATSFSLPATDALTSLPFSGGTYHFKIRAYNWYGQGPWSSVKDWPTLSGLGVGSTSFTFYLKGLEEGKLVINSIASPKATTADALKAVVNTKAGAGVVAAIAKWDAVSGTSIARGYDASGAALEGSSADFAIGAGEGVQVYTTVAVDNLVLE